MRTTHRVLAIALLAGCAALAARLIWRANHAPARPVTPVAMASTPHLAAAGPTPSAGSAAPAAEPAPQALPETLPDVRVPDLSGKPRSLRDFIGHPLIVNFWATWCEPCRREMPLLQQLQQSYRSQGLQVLGVADDSRAAVEQYLHTRPVDYTILAGEDEATEAMNRFGAEPVLPFSIFVDAQGRVVVVKLGELHREEADYILAAERNLAEGRENLAQTRSTIDAKLRELAIARAKAPGNSGDAAR